MEAHMNIVKIQAQVKEYDWGNPSFIPTLLGQKPDGKPKAELWMGTHPSGESLIDGTGQKLSDFLLKDTMHWYGKDHLELVLAPSCLFCSRSWPLNRPRSPSSVIL